MCNIEIILYTPDDLYYNDYIFTRHDSVDPKIHGVPDNTVFNNKNAHEVVYMINAIAEYFIISDKNILKIFECFIHDHYPSWIKTQIELINWFEEYLFNKLNKKIKRGK